MSGTQDSNSALVQHRILSDVLPTTEVELPLPYNLNLKWTEATLNTPGQELDREHTQETPTVSLVPTPSKPLENLVLIMIDPDLMMDKDTYFGQVRHWLITSASTSPSGTLSVPTSPSQAPYTGPAPLPNYLYSRPHRYIFILAQAPGPITITPEELEDMKKPYAVAFKGKQGEVQDLKDRWGFDAEALIKKKGLKVLSVSFMLVGGNVRSAGKNAVLMGEAIVNKVVGR